MNRSNAARPATIGRTLRFIAIAFAILIAILGALAFVLISKGASFVILPEDAAVSSTLRVTRGPAFAYDGTVYTAGAAFDVEIAADGFKPATIRVSEQQLGHEIDIVLEPLPASLSVRTDPVLEDVAWKVNGTILAHRPSVVFALAPGTHTIEAIHPDYEPQSMTETFARGQVAEHSFTLSPFLASAVFNATPSGATITVNGQVRGVTPLELDLPAGELDVSVSLQGYGSVTETLRISSDTPRVTRNYRLSPADASLLVNVMPEGGQLLIAGKTVAAGRSVSVPSGQNVTLIYSKPGYQTIERRIELGPEERRAINLIAEPDLGSVSITSVPPAEVLINGTSAGAAPLTLTLKAVAQTITLQREGYVSKTITVTPSAARPLVIEERLTTELSARLSELGSGFKNSLGQEMLLFQPNEVFTMGAPRGEKGRRANEFLRQVRLDRPFLVSRTHVTQAQFAQFSKEGGSGPLPVRNVSWTQAASFANWLSDRDGLTPVYQIRNGRYGGYDPRADGYRLLTEAEWEWLARKANKRRQTRFTWGDETVIPVGSGNIADETARGTVGTFVADYNDAYAGVAPVGSFGAEPSGLHDFSGNLREWVHDVYDVVPPTAGAVALNPMGPRQGNGFVIKGSSYADGSLTGLRASWRDTAVSGNDKTGFRIARYVAAPTGGSE